MLRCAEAIEKIKFDKLIASGVFLCCLASVVMLIHGRVRLKLATFNQLPFQLPVTRFLGVLTETFLVPRLPWLHDPRLLSQALVYWASTLRVPFQWTPSPFSRIPCGGNALCLRTLFPVR